MKSLVAVELRQLARQLLALTRESSVASVALPVVHHTVSHLELLANEHDRQQAGQPGPYDPELDRH
jgi:hypothetical protein